MLAATPDVRRRRESCALEGRACAKALGRERACLQGRGRDGVTGDRCPGPREPGAVGCCKVPDTRAAGLGAVRPFLCQKWESA